MISAYDIDSTAESRKQRMAAVRDETADELEVAWMVLQYALRWRVGRGGSEHELARGCIKEPFHSPHLSRNRNGTCAHTHARRQMYPGES